MRMCRASTCAIQLLASQPWQTVITLKRGQVTYTVPVGTYTVENIATMFRLLPQRSWLREGAFGNNRVYFPVEGQFDLSTVGELSDVEVEGIPMPPPPPPLPGAVNTTSIVRNNTPELPWIYTRDRWQWTPIVFHTDNR